MKGHQWDVLGLEGEHLMKLDSGNDFKRKGITNFLVGSIIQHKVEDSVGMILIISRYNVNII